MNHRNNIKNLRDEQQAQLLEMCTNAFCFDWNGYKFSGITFRK
jgi:hypothetical protein